MSGMRRITNVLSIDWRFVHIFYVTFSLLTTRIQNRDKTITICVQFHFEPPKWIDSRVSFETIRQKRKTKTTKWCVNSNTTRKNCWRKWTSWTGKLTIICMKQKYYENTMCENVKTIQSRWTYHWNYANGDFQIRFHFDIFRYNKLSRTIRELATRISEIDSKDPFRTEMSAMLLEKLYVIGLIPTKWDLQNAVNISASSFCRRRLPVVMVRSEWFAMKFRQIYNINPNWIWSQIICPNTLKMPPIWLNKDTSVSAPMWSRIQLFSFHEHLKTSWRGWTVRRSENMLWNITIW